MELENKNKENLMSPQQDIAPKPSRKGDPIVRVVDVEKLFKIGDNEIQILKKVSLDVYQGDFVMLIGPSGCGKSTLLHIIYGLEAPTKGDVIFQNDSIWKHNKDWRAEFRNKEIGFIPQQAFWLKSLTVLENVAIPAIIGGMSMKEGTERAAKLLELVGMTNWAHYRPYDLSGGQQQKVAFARALLLDPKIIIADEPTGNLDQKSGVQVMDLIKSFCDRLGVTILMVTHNADQHRYATNVVEMIDGVVVSQNK
jgi:putative ABC transport system ATP-binding protein